MSYSKVNTSSNSGGNGWNKGSNFKGSKMDLDEFDDDHQFLIEDDEDDSNALDDTGFAQPNQRIPSEPVRPSAQIDLIGHNNLSSSAVEPDISRVPPPPPPPYSQLESRITQATGQQFEQRRFMGGDTLDESVSTTLMRDFRSIGWRLRQVVWHTPSQSLRADTASIPYISQHLSSLPSESSESPLNQEWDLWGPLVFSLIISLCMSMIAPSHQASIVFSGVFSLIWLGEAVLTLNIKLLGGTVSFFNALSVIGYCLFLLVPAVLVSTFVKLILVRLIVDTIFVIWAIYSATRGLQDSGVLPSRVALATFPVGLFFIGLGWLCVIT